MTYLIALLCLVLVACAVGFHRMGWELRDAEESVRLLSEALKEMRTNNHYLRERNKELNVELLRSQVRVTTVATPTPVTVTLPPNHPQKRQPKSIRGKRK